jgi:hypothetical protein
MSEIHLEILGEVADNLERLSRTLRRNEMPSAEQLERYERDLHLTGRTIEVIKTTVYK